MSVTAFFVGRRELLFERFDFELGLDLRLAACFAIVRGILLQDPRIPQSQMFLPPRTSAECVARLTLHGEPNPFRCNTYKLGSQMLILKDLQDG